MDSAAVERRTLAIGRELFEAVHQRHAHLSATDRWAGEVLRWCMDDPEIKRRVLRFVDVLPSVRSARACARLVREYFPSASQRLPAPLRLGAALARPGLVTAPAVAALVRILTERLARQFIAAADVGEVPQVVGRLAGRGMTCSLDVLGEQVLSEREADAYAGRYLRLVQELAAAYGALPGGDAPRSCGPRINLSVKPSALTPRFDPITPERSVDLAAARLLPVLEAAAGHGALVNLDMEHVELRGLTLELAKRMLVHPAFAGRRGELGIVLQAYLRDADPVLEALLSWLESHERALTIRLVKGAYWDYEVANARQRAWPVPVRERKAGTDAAFERLTARLLSAFPLVRTAIASHNIRSIAHAMAAAEALDVSPDAMEFQFLYGMGDPIAEAVRDRGYPVRVYAPIGELIPGMAYLVRRVLENTANESFLRQDLLRERDPDEMLAAPVETEPAAGSAPGAANEPCRDFSREDAREAMRAALSEVRGSLGKAYPLLIGRDEIELESALIVRNPARPEDVVGRVSQAGPSHVAQAVDEARRAQPAWERLPVPERAACLRRAAALMRRRRDALAAWEVLEVGKPWREADADVVEAIDYLEYYGLRMEELAAGRSLPQLPGERNLLRDEAAGVAAVIAPWNFPVAILTGMSSAALAAGNAVILKPAEQSSVTGALVARLLREAGVPPGVVQFVPGRGEDVGRALVEHPGVHQVLFTGSRAVGLSIIRTCAQVPAGQRHIKRVIAELGGKNAVIVDETADLDAVVPGVLASAFGYAGQKCSAASRLIAHRAVAERLVARLSEAMDRLVIGDPAEPEVDLGPLIDADARERLRRALRQAEEAGRIAYRYPEPRLPQSGYFVSPALAAGIPPDHPVAAEELFGPLLCVFEAASFGEALELANDSPYALTGGVYSRSPARIEQAIRAFDVGNLYINRPITGAIVGRQPFGGHRLSGLGTKAGGPDYLLQLLRQKTVSVNTSRHGMPLD